jgi:hypothetical protein
MHEIEFIPVKWLERAAWSVGLVVYSGPIAVERRHFFRRAADRTARLLLTLLPAQG